MTYHRWKHPDAPSALILEPRNTGSSLDGPLERQDAADILCPDDDDSLLTCEPVEMTPEEFEALGEFEG